MTTHTFGARNAGSPIIEAEHMTAAEQRAALEKALPTLAAKVHAFSNAIRVVADALESEPLVPASLRLAADAVQDAHNALTDGDVCDVAATAGWLADALEREASRPTMYLYRHANGAWFNRFTGSDGAVDDRAIPHFTPEAPGDIVLVAMRAAYPGAAVTMADRDN